MRNRRFLDRAAVSWRVFASHGPHQSIDRSVKLQRVSILPELESGNTYRCQEALGHETGPCVQEKLHLRDLLVNIFHELNDKVDQLVLQHLFRVEVRNQERDVIALPLCQSCCLELHECTSTSTYIDRLPPQDEERLRSLGQEPRKLVYQDVLNLIRLLYPYADTHAVH